MKNNVTISQETFNALMWMSRLAQNHLEGEMKNSRKQLEKFPNSNHWQESVEFWQREMQSAENAYKKALEEAIYS